MIYWLYKLFEPTLQSWGIYLIDWPSVRALGLRMEQLAETVSRGSC